MRACLIGVVGDEIVLTEKMVFEKWAEIAPIIDCLNERTDTADEFAVHPHSSLAEDDLRSDPYQVSHTVRAALMAAVDHLHANKTLLWDLKMVHVAAPASLSRGALENLSAAFWVLHPSRGDERLRRTLRWHLKNTKDQETATSEMGLEAPLPVEERLEKIRAVASACGIAGKLAVPTSTEMVRYADHNAETPTAVLTPWRICSGFAHGRPWAYLGALTQEIRPSGGGDNVVTVRLTNDHTKTLYPMLASVDLAQDVLRLLARRSTAP